MARNQTAESGVSRNSVQLLLAEDVPSLGSRGEIVRVRRGYARNYLLPQGLATIATEHNKRMVEKHKQRIAEIEADRLKQVRKLADDISRYSVTIEARANEEGHLYGSVGAPEISKALQTAGYSIEADHVKLEGPLKELAMYTVRVQLHPEVATDIKVWVVPEAGSVRSK